MQREQILNYTRSMIQASVTLARQGIEVTWRVGEADVPAADLERQLEQQAITMDGEVVQPNQPELYLRLNDTIGGSLDVSVETTPTAKQYFQIFSEPGRKSLANPLLDKLVAMLNWTSGGATHIEPREPDQKE